MNDLAIQEALSMTRLGEFLDDTKELERLIKYNEYCIFSPGDIILEQGKRTSGMYVIIEGTALSTAKVLGEGGTYIATLSKGNLLGEISLIDKSPSPTSVIASSQVKCLLVTNSYYDMLAIYFPETQHKITKAIALEVCLKIIYLHHKIANIMEQPEMVSRPTLAFINPEAKVTTISVEQLPFNKLSLHKNVFFVGFTDQEFEELLRHVKVIRAQKHCLLIDTGAPEPPCYIVLRGAVQSSIITADKVAKLLVFGPISIFGSISTVDERHPAVFTYTTCEKALLLKIDKQHINNLRNNFPKLWFKLFNLICRSLVTIEKAADKLDVRIKSEFYNR